MKAVQPEYSHSEVNKAGDILRDSTGSQDEQPWATEVLNNWRAAHNYPINTFQATLRHRLEIIHREALVAQRLKRIPSILYKLRDHSTMQLSQMQDIGGLRAVVEGIDDVRALYDDYKRNVRFQHELVGEKDYIDKPKLSGYRSVHLVYRYNNRAAPEYGGLLLEIQIRTRRQHAWATTVETMGTFLKYPLKSSIGPDEWLKFLSLTGSAFARLEGTSPVPGYESMSDNETYREVARQSRELQVREKLLGFRVATSHINRNKNRGSYFLLVLDPGARRVTLRAFAKDRFADATARYLESEQEIVKGSQQQAVLVATASVKLLRGAYPNFFLDTSRFLEILRTIEQLAGAS